MNPLDAPISDGDVPIVSPWPTVFKYGMIGSGILIAINFLSFMMINIGAGMSTIISSILFSLLIIVVYILIMVFSIKEFRDKWSNGYITLGTGILVSYGSAMMMGVIGFIFSIFYLLVLDPDYMNRAMVRQYESMGIDPSTIPNMGEMTMGMIVGTQAMSFVIGMVMGIVLSLIISAVMKKTDQFQARNY